MFLLRIELIISTHAWLSQLIIMLLPFNFSCHSLTATTTVRSSNYVMDNCWWVIIGGKSSWKYSPSQMAPHPVRLASVENNCSLDSRNSIPITETALYLSRKCSHLCKSCLSSYDTGIIQFSSFNKCDIKSHPGRHNCKRNLIYQPGLAIDV